MRIGSLATVLTLATMILAGCGGTSRSTGVGYSSEQQRRTGESELAPSIELNLAARLDFAGSKARGSQPFLSLRIDSVVEPGVDVPLP